MQASEILERQSFTVSRLHIKVKVRDWINEKIMPSKHLVLTR